LTAVFSQYSAAIDLLNTCEHMSKLQIFTVLNVQLILSRIVTLYILVGGYHGFRGVCCHHPQVKMKVEAACSSET
jgi:hypothetical protein